MAEQERPLYNIPLDKMGHGQMQQMCGGVERVEEWIDQLRNWAGDDRNQMPFPLKMRLQALFETARERMAAVDMLNGRPENGASET